MSVNKWIGLVLSTCVISNNYAQELNIPHDLYQKYKQKFDQEHINFINRLLHIFGVSHEDWREELVKARLYRDEIDEAYREKCEKFGQLSPEFVAMFNALVCEQGLEESGLSIINNGGLPMAGKGFVGISEDCFDSIKLTMKEREALLLHEIAHVVHEDAVVWSALYSLLEKAPWYRKAIAFPIMWKWHLFKERRADLSACLAGYSRAVALAGALQKIAHISPKIQTSHPTFKTRNNYIQAFCEQVRRAAVAEGGMVSAINV